MLDRCVDACHAPEEIVPKVSVLVRTCARPAVLREALISLRNQTYRNIEVIVVEDGKPTAEKMIREEFGGLNIVYHATGEKVGRCRAGNLAMALSGGKYLNFLDDDDVLCPDHVEVLVQALRAHPETKIAYALALETPIHVESSDPYRYRITDQRLVFDQPFNRLMLLHHNYFPIQTVLFERSIYEALGGLDETLEVLEDWDLWVRYACEYAFLYVGKITSFYRVPADRAQREKRRVQLLDAAQKARETFAAYPKKWAGVDLAREQKELDAFCRRERWRSSFLYRALGKAYRIIKQWID